MLKVSGVFNIHKIEKGFQYWGNSLQNVIF